MGPPGNTICRRHFPESAKISYNAIEIEKSNWILGFTGKSLVNPEREKWAVKREGGDFDQFTGATITPRAVIDAVRLALQYFDAKEAFLFNAPAEPEGGAAP